VTDTGFFGICVAKILVSVTGFAAINNGTEVPFFAVRSGAQAGGGT
jgi:hypothetical protein